MALLLIFFMGVVYEQKKLTQLRDQRFSSQIFPELYFLLMETKGALEKKDLQDKPFSSVLIYSHFLFKKTSLINKKHVTLFRILKH